MRTRALHYFATLIPGATVNGSELSVPLFVDDYDACETLFAYPSSDKPGSFEVCIVAYQHGCPEPLSLSGAYDIPEDGRSDLSWRNILHLLCECSRSIVPQPTIDRALRSPEVSPDA